MPLLFPCVKPSEQSTRVFLFGSPTWHESAKKVLRPVWLERMCRLDKQSLCLLGINASWKSYEILSRTWRGTPPDTHVKGLYCCTADVIYYFSSFTHVCRMDRQNCNWRLIDWKLVSQYKALTIYKSSILHIFSTKICTSYCFQMFLEVQSIQEYN